MFNIDEELKKHIWNKKKKKQRWTKIKYLDLFCLVIPIYIAFFSIFHSVINQNFTYFYGVYGTNTLGSRLLSMFFITFISYAISSVPYFIVHTIFILTAGECFLDRVNEKIEITEEELIYSFAPLLKPKSIKKIFIKTKELTKITFMEDISKMHLYGNVYMSEMKHGIEREIKLEDFVLYDYFNPSLIKYFDKKEIAIEYLFCFDCNK